MNPINYEKPNGLQRQDLIILKMSGLGCGCLVLLGWLIFTVAQLQYIGKAQPSEKVKPGDGRRELKTPTKPSEQSQIITKKPAQPVVIEEGSEAYFCIQNNGGDGCLDRDRFAPNFKIVAPPKPENNLVNFQDCGRYFNGKPNCI